MKLTKQAYTAGSKEPVAKRVKDGQSVGMVCGEPWASGQTSRNRVKAAADHAEPGGAYGSPRMVLELRARGFSASEARVGRAGARQRHPRPPQAAHRGCGGLEAPPAGSGEPARQKLHAGGAGPGLGAVRPLCRSCRHEGRRPRIYRGLLQPEAPAFNPRPQIANPVSGAPDQRSAIRKNW